MAWKSFGEVTVTAAGTPIRATINMVNPAADVKAHTVAFQQVSGNTGKIYIQDRQTLGAGNIGRVHVLAIPTSNTLPSVSAGIEYAPGGFNLASYWIDAEVNGEKCLVSTIEA